MKRQFGYLFWVMVFLSVPEVYAQKNPADLKFSALEFHPPKVERVVLDNGIIVYLKEDHELPLFYGRAMLHCGGMWDTPDKVGLANMTGIVLRTGGTETKTGDKIDDELEYIAGSIETSIGDDAATATLSVLKEDIATGLKLFADVLMHPAFREEKINLAKMQAIESYRRRNDDPSGIVSREFQKVLFGADSPYGWEQTDKTITAIKREDMVAFHKKYFHPNNMILGIAGDFQREEILKLLREVFKDWKKTTLTLPPIPKVIPGKRPLVNVIKKEINQSNIMIGHLGIRRNNPDYQAIQIMNEILSFQRLFFQIRTEKGWAYQVGSRFTLEPDLGTFYGIMKTKVNSTHEAITLMQKIFRDIREAPVTDKELQTAKDSFLNSFVFEFESPSQIVNKQAQLEFYNYPKDYLETFTSKIRAVTKEDVQQVAKKYILPDELIIMVVGDPAHFDSPLSSFGPINEISVEQETKK